MNERIAQLGKNLERKRVELMQEKDELLARLEELRDIKNIVSGIETNHKLIEKYKRDIMVLKTELGLLSEEDMVRGKLACVSFEELKNHAEDVIGLNYDHDQKRPKAVFRKPKDEAMSAAYKDEDSPVIITDLEEGEEEDPEVGRS